LSASGDSSAFEFGFVRVGFVSKQKNESAFVVTYDLLSLNGGVSAAKYVGKSTHAQENNKDSDLKQYNAIETGYDPHRSHVRQTPSAAK